jgi:8-amino-7-oxononanoate synthase
MLDFTSALYLGLRHPSSSLRPWSQFTTGVPAALASPQDAQSVAYQLAQLQGCEHGVLGNSSFHLFWDLFGILARRPVAVYVDAGAYPIARWGVERAAARGVRVREFAHHDAEELRSRLKQDGRGRLRPLLVTDGFCPGCGKPAPLSAYLDSVRACGGRLIVDDTQALGIFGDSPSPDAPYGQQGGGILPQLQIGGPDVLAISSLAKGFGAPVAVLSGSWAAVEEFKANSETRVHCSPPSVAVIRAAGRALRVNRKLGDRLRLRLAGLVMRFRRSAKKAGLGFRGGLFPVQTLVPTSKADTVRLHERLLRNGVRTVLRRAPHGQGLRLSFVITARHTPEAIERAVYALTKIE